MNLSVMKSTIIVLLFIILGFGIYSNTMEVPFYFDDIERIKENPHIRMTNLSFREIGEAGFKGSSTRPIAFITFALNYYFHQYDPMGYHIVNIFIHLFNGILLYLFVKTTLQFPPGSPKRDQSAYQGLNPSFIAFFTALVWLVHPIQTQSVTYIVQRLNSLAAMFYLISFLCYIKGRLCEHQRLHNLQSEKSTKIKAPRSSRLNTSRGSKGNMQPAGQYHYLWFMGSAVAWILALGCKQTAATLPFFILLYEWYFFQDLSRDWLRRNLKYFLGIIILFGLIAFIYLGLNPWEKILSLNAFAKKEFIYTERVLTQFRVVIYYLGLLFYPNPSRLNLDYDFPLSHSLIEPVTTILSLGLIIGLVGLAVYLAKKDRLISFCILWFFGNLIIESSIIPLAIIFEHRTYLPSMLVCLIVVMVASRYIKQRWFVTALLCVVVLLFSIWTYQRNDVWKDAVSFWSDNVRKSENKARPRNNLGNALFRQDKLEDSIIQYREALRINPQYANAHNNLGLALASQGSLQEAINHFSESLRIKPDYAKAHYNLGIALVNHGIIEEAISHLSEAVRINPDYALAHYSLGVVLGRQGSLKEAIGHFAEAIRADPGYAQAHYALGLALSNQGDLEGAVKHFSEALRINPDHAGARTNLESALQRMGKSTR